MDKRLLIQSGTFVATFFLTLSGVAGAEDMLDGRQYAIIIKTDQLQIVREDTLSFQNKKFESALSTNEGFPSVGYKAVSQSGVITFSAQMESSENVLRAWTGVIRASEIEGDLTETRWVIRDPMKSKDVEGSTPELTNVSQTYSYRGLKK